MNPSLTGQLVRGSLAGSLLFVAALHAQTPSDPNHAASRSTPAAGTAPQQGQSLPSFGSAWVDVFDRPDSTSMGADWTEYVGDMAIVSNHGQGTLTSGWSYMLHNSGALAHADATMDIDLLPPSGASGPHVALIAGAAPASTQWFYTKLQDNNSDGTYDRIYFYRNGNSTGWGTGFSVALAQPFTTARVSMYFTNGGDTMHVDIDSNFDGIVDEAVTNSGALAVTPAGDGFGIGTWAMGAYDFWLVTTTIHAQAQTYGSGCPGTGGAVPAISATGLPQLGNNNYSIDVQNGLPSSFAVLVAGFAQASVPIGACTALVAPPWATAAVPLDAAGAGSTPLPIPGNTALLGASLAAQYVVLDPNGPFLNFATLSDGLGMILGR